MVNKDWSSDVLHDSLYQVKLERVLGWAILLVRLLSIDELLELCNSLGKVLFDETRAHLSFLEVCNGESLHFSVSIIILKTIELVAQIIVGDSAVCMVYSTEFVDFALLELNSCLEIKEIDTLSAMDHQYLAISCEACILKEVCGILLLYKWLLVFILIESNFTNELELSSLSIVYLNHKHRWLFLLLFLLLILLIYKMLLNRQVCLLLILGALR